MPLDDMTKFVPKHRRYLAFRQPGDEGLADEDELAIRPGVGARAVHDNERRRHAGSVSYLAKNLADSALIHRIRDLGSNLSNGTELVSAADLFAANAIREQNPKRG